MYTGVLATCFSMHFVYAWYPLRSEEGVGSPGTGLEGASVGNQEKKNVREEQLLLRCYCGNNGITDLHPT